MLIFESSSSFFLTILRRMEGSGLAGELKFLGKNLKFWVNSGFFEQFCLFLDLKLIYLDNNILMFLNNLPEF